jgi:hypothetical protein
MWIKSALGH